MALIQWSYHKDPAKVGTTEEIEDIALVNTLVREGRATRVPTPAPDPAPEPEPEAESESVDVSVNETGWTLTSGQDE